MERLKNNKRQLLTVNYSLSSQRGISLIEVIISMFMVVVLFVLYLSALNLVTVIKKLNMENIAYHVANKQMENLREIPFASLPASGTISDPMLAKIPSGAGNYAVTNYSPMTNMKEIAVTVTWNDGQSKQLIIKTLAGNGGINP